MARQIINLPFRTLKGPVTTPTGPDDAASDGVAGHTAGNTFNSDPDNPNTGTFYLQTPGARGNGAIQLDFGGLWEPWGDTLCANHEWGIRAYRSSPYTNEVLTCAITPVDPIFAQTSTSYNIGTQNLQLSAEGPGPTTEVVYLNMLTGALNVGVASKIKIKCTANAGDEPQPGTCYVGLYIETDVDEQWFALAKGNGFATDIWGWVDQGDGGGSEMTIDLSDYSMVGQLIAVGFFVYAGQNGELAELNCNYVDVIWQ